MIQITIKIDEEEDQDIAAWVKSFQGKRYRVLSLNIRKAIKFYLCHGVGMKPGTRPVSAATGDGLGK
jgi:hypothetical protein